MAMKMVRLTTMGLMLILANLQLAEASCKRARRDYEINVWKTTTGVKGTILKDEGGADLGCLLQAKDVNDDGGLCAVADQQSHFFGISVNNHCDKDIEAVIRIVSDSKTPISFKKGNQCQPALTSDPMKGGASDKIKKNGGVFEVVCKTDKYLPDPNSENPRAAYYVSVLKVVNTDVKEGGTFDPEIVIDRNGQGRHPDAGTQFDIKHVLLILGLASMGMLASAALGYFRGKAVAPPRPGAPAAQ